MKNRGILLAFVFVATLFGYLGYVFLQEKPVEPADNQPVAAIDIEPVPAVSTPPANAIPISALAPEQPPAGVKGMAVTIADMRDLSIGDSISFFVPQEDVAYAGAVDEVIVSEAGNKSIVGMFYVDGADYRFVFTLGQQYTFGTLHTPKGRYQLESIGGQGRLVSTSEINADRDFTIPDYYVPETRTSKKS